MNARTTETGIVRMGMIAEGMCQRKTRMTRLTMMISIDQFFLERVDGPFDQLERS